MFKVAQSVHGTGHLASTDTYIIYAKTKFTPHNHLSLQRAICF